MTSARAKAWGAQELKADSDTAPLDAELLLMEVLQCSRAHLISHAERSLGSAEQARYQQLIARRKQGEPLAYILGHKEFWSLDLRVTAATLVPRPETELLVERLLQIFPEVGLARRVADLGTGCGAVALALAHERPAWQMYATDQSPAALEVAVQNAAYLGLKTIQFCQGPWCAALPALFFDAIVSNPPYLSEKEGSLCAKDLTFEPVSALVSGKDGLRDLAAIISGAKNYLSRGGYLLLEHGSTQAAAVSNMLKKEDYIEITCYHDLAGIERVTQGRWFR